MKPKKERFLMVRVDIYELLVTPTGIERKKRIGIPIIDLEKVEFISEGDSALESIISMSTSGTRFLVKMPYEELKQRYQRFIQS